MKYTREIPN